MKVELNMALIVKFTRNVQISIPGDNKHVRLKVGSARNIQKDGQDVVIYNPLLGTSQCALQHPVIFKETFQINLPDIKPRPIKVRPEWTPAYAEKVQNAEFDRAVQARADAAVILNKVKHYSSGPFACLEVVEDTESLLDGDFEPTHAEAAVAGIEISKKPTSTTAAIALESRRIVDTANAATKGKK